MHQNNEDIIYTIIELPEKELPIIGETQKNQELSTVEEENSKLNNVNVRIEFQNDSTYFEEAAIDEIFVDQNSKPCSIKSSTYDGDTSLDASNFNEEEVFEKDYYSTLNYESLKRSTEEIHQDIERSEKSEKNGFLNRFKNLVNIFKRNNKISEAENINLNTNDNKNKSSNKLNISFNEEKCMSELYKNKLDLIFVEAKKPMTYKDIDINDPKFEEKIEEHGLFRF